MKRENILQIGDLPDNAIDHFDQMCNAVNDALEDIVVETNCKDIQIYLNAIQYIYSGQLASYLFILGKDKEKYLEDYLQVLRKNVLSRWESFREEKTPGV